MMKKKLEALLAGVFFAAVPAVALGVALAVGGLPKAGLAAGCIVFFIGLDVVFFGKNK
jgi:hypothetical protein